MWPLITFSRSLLNLCSLLFRCAADGDAIANANVPLLEVELHQLDSCKPFATLSPLLAESFILSAGSSRSLSLAAPSRSRLKWCCFCLAQLVVSRKSAARTAHTTWKPPPRQVSSAPARTAARCSRASAIYSASRPMDASESIQVSMSVGLSVGRRGHTHNHTGALARVFS